MIPEPIYPDKGNSFSEVPVIFKKGYLLEDPGTIETLAPTAN